MSEQTEEITQPSPFSEGAWNTTPPVKQEPIVDEDLPTAETKDPVIADKDEDIKEDKPESDKPNEPEKIPSATPKPIQDTPDEDKKQPENVVSLKKWVEENEDKIYSVLSNNHTLKNIDNLSPEEAIRLNLKYENKDYSDEEINDLYQEKYSSPEQPEQEITETDEEFEAREEAYKKQVEKLERKMARDSKNAKTELLQYKQELDLPNIPQAFPEKVEPTQEELAQFKKQQEEFLQAVDGSFTTFNDYQATFKDEDVEIPVAYKVEKEEKEALKPLLNSLNTDLPQFFQQLNWVDKDGQLNVNKVVSDLHILQNKDAVIQKFVNEAGNKRYAEAIKAQKNIDFSGQQRRGSLEPSVKEEVDKKVRGFLQAT